MYTFSQVYICETRLECMAKHGDEDQLCNMFRQANGLGIVSLAKVFTDSGYTQQVDLLQELSVTDMPLLCS